MHIGLWWVDLYTLRITGAVVSAAAWLIWQTSHTKLPSLSIGLLAMTILALILGRAGYVATNAAYFHQNPDHILAVRGAPGLHGFGAVLGGMLGAVIWAILDGQRVWTLLSRLSPAALWVAAGAWWACSDAGCLWGRTVQDPQGLQRWWVTPTPDLYHNVALRIAVADLGAGLAILTTLLALWLKNRGFYAFTLYLLGATCLTLLREDPSPTLESLRLDTLLHSGLFLVCGGASLAHLLRMEAASKPQRRLTPEAGNS